MKTDKLTTYINRLTEQLEAITGEDFRSLDYIDPSDFLFNEAEIIYDHYDARDYILEQLENNGAFEVEIIYYYKAHQYLAEKQAIDDALEIADEYGYEIKDLTSERLASLYASQEARNEFLDLSMEIFEAIASICEEYTQELEQETLNI